MLISVIIPAYNVEKTLERSVKSVINQSFDDYEIIIVNDGSTDKSGKICDELAKQDARIKVIHKENGGLSSARNVGIENAEGEYISFLDSDDEFKEDIFAQFYEVYKFEKPDMFIFNILRVSDYDEETKNAVDEVLTDSETAVKMLLTNNGLDFYAWNKIYHKNLFETVRFPEGKLYEDTVVSYLTTKTANKVITTSEIGILYYENPESIVAQTFNPKQMDNVTERLRMLDMVKQEFPNLASLTALRVLNGALSTGYKIASASDVALSKEYGEELEKIIDEYKEDFEKSSHIDWKRKVAWNIFKKNKKLYAITYRKYLGK